MIDPYVGASDGRDNQAMPPKIPACKDDQTNEWNEGTRSTSHSQRAFLQAPKLFLLSCELGESIER